MPFASPTAQKIGRYLGYPASNSSQQAIAAALSAIETMTNGIYSNAAIATVEEYLGQLDTLSTAINSQRSIEGSTLLPELRREYRRFVALVSIATELEIYTDTSGASLV